jgi:hypothetical protein
MPYKPTLPPAKKPEVAAFFGGSALTPGPHSPAFSVSSTFWGAPMALQFPPDAHETELTSAHLLSSSGGMTASTACHSPPVSLSNSGFAEASPVLGKLPS